MQKPKQGGRSIQKLVRFREFSEKRALVSLQIATHEAREAQLAHKEAVSRLDEVSTWKAVLDDRGVLQIAHYEHALGLEQQATLQVEHAEKVKHLADTQRNIAHDAHVIAANSVEVAVRRDERVVKMLANQEEHRIADEVNDLWLARNYRDLA